MKSLRLFSLSLIVLLACSDLLAQQASEGIRPFARRESGNALTIIYEGQPENVEHVLEAWLKESSGDRSSSYRGFRMWEKARIQPFSEHELDYYLRVEKVSRQDREHSEVTLFVSAGNENFLNSTTDPRLFSALENWLESQQKEVTMYELELAIEAQEKVLEKTVKDYDRLQRDSVDLQTTLTETLKSIEENKVQNQNQRISISEEEERLQAFREELEAVRTGRSAILRTDEQQQQGDGQVIDEIIDLQPGSGGGGN